MNTQIKIRFLSYTACCLIALLLAGCGRSGMSSDEIRSALNKQYSPYITVTDVTVLNSQEEKYDGKSDLTQYFKAMLQFDEDFFVQDGQERDYKGEGLVTFLKPVHKMGDTMEVKGMARISYNQYKERNASVGIQGMIGGDPISNFAKANPIIKGSAAEAAYRTAAAQYQAEQAKRQQEEEKARREYQAAQAKKYQEEAQARREKTKEAEATTLGYLIGTWQMQSQFGSVTATFEPNGNCRFIYGGATHTGTWSLDGNILMEKTDGYDIKFNIESIDDKQFNFTRLNDNSVWTGVKVIQKN